MKNSYKINKVILSETKNLMRSFTSVQDDSESGRSMVEMLGVLAVIGVLSVAGIAGYSIAMRSYRTNEIVNAASMFYVLTKAQNQGNGPSGNIAYADVGGTNPSGASLTYADNAFTITFTDTDDCTMAANKLGDKATADCANKKITVNFGETSATKTILENTTDNFLWEDPGTYEQHKSCDPSTFTECFVADGTYEGHMYGRLSCENAEVTYDHECCEGYTDEQAAQWLNLPPCSTVL